MNSFWKKNANKKINYFTGVLLTELHKYSDACPAAFLDSLIGSITE